MSFARAAGRVRRRLGDHVPRTMSCSDFAEALPAYLEAKLTEWQRLAFEIHIKTCRACREDLISSGQGREGGSSMKPLLRRLALKAAAKGGRDLGFDRPIEDLLPAFEGGQRSRAPAEPRAGDGHGARDSLRQAIAAQADQIPESYRIVWQLHDIEDMSLRQVSEVLELSEAAVRLRLHKARAALTTLCAALLERKG